MKKEDKQFNISELMAKGREKLADANFLEQESDAPETDPTGRANRKYLDSIFFRTKFLNPVGDTIDTVDTSLSLFGVKLQTPTFCCPLSGFQRVKNSLSEISIGLKKAGSLLMLGVGGFNELQTAIDTGVPVVKIVKPYRKTELIHEQLKYAKDHGCVAVGMDVDRFWGARRKGDWIDRTDAYGPQKTVDLQQIISSVNLPFIIKGVLSVEDAQEAVRMGASAIIVSSHGFSSISFAVPPIVVISDIVEAVGNEIDVLIDTGFRTGNDVMKALALGAKAIGFGSPILCAWAIAGSQGVENLLNQITAELKRTMASTGCPNLSAIDRSAITDLGRKA